MSRFIQTYYGLRINSLLSQIITSQFDFKEENLYMKATGIVRRIEEYGIIGQKSTKPA